MKHEKIFRNFLCSVVNLNQTRVDKLTSSSESVVDFIKNSNEFKNIFISDSAQGSYGHRTIIKPLSGNEFDADVIIFLKEQEGWEAKDYINNIKAALQQSSTYKDMLKSGNRCVCINYSGDFHIDIVPCVVKELAVGKDVKQYYICNKRENEFEQTDPEAYKTWVKSKNQFTKNNQLIKCIRLFKYLRDIKTTFSCKSILLTTLIAEQVHEYELTSTHFTDIATTLRTIVTRLDEYLQAHEEMPKIQNPVQREENFNRHWDQQKFDNFKLFISKYRGWIEDAYDEQNREISIEKWRKVFGQKFHSTTGISSKVKNYNQVLEEASLESFPIPEHCKPHPWEEADVLENIELIVLHRPSLLIGNFTKALQNLTFPKEQSLRFEVVDSVPDDCSIYWQITNIGEEATLRGQLRGGFEVGSRVKEETTSYKGNHFVEAFIVQDNTLIARSGKRVIPIR
ncbi:SMODS domain-containing nucleotidyltransferase [Shewanella baltica]|uniref:SMODS domain-containing nucleotidyltransferase n=1 Tax=Shewanella baltica TaxID=62322 RepID=UPI0039AFC619